MKKHHFLSFLKGAALACLAFAAFTGACLTLTSCGGGGDDETDDKAKAAQYFEGKYLTLQPTAAACVVKVNERFKGTGVTIADISYGNSAPVRGMMTITDAIVNPDGTVQQVDLEISTYNSTLLDHDDFKSWWGARTGEDGEDLSFDGAMTIHVKFTSSTTDPAVGSYAIYLDVTDGEGNTNKRTLTGTAVLGYSPVY